MGLVRDVACTAAQAAGTEILVVAAMHSDQVSDALGASLLDCSSEVDNPGGRYMFLNNADAESLRNACADIANRLSVIRRTH